MHFKDFSFGSLQIDGTTYDYDVGIDRGKISKRHQCDPARDMWSVQRLLIE
jgi:hypothetical protein